MFWPTDDAINSLPGDFQNKLRDPLKVLELIHFIQYHVVAHIQVRARGIFLCFIVTLCLARQCSAGPQKPTTSEHAIKE